MVKKLLDISEYTLRQHGLVSESVTTQMAEGIRKTAQTDYSLAVTAILDADCATDEKPLG
jgi:nicotinamide-nucleotide amidase